MRGNETFSELKEIADFFPIINTNAGLMQLRINGESHQKYIRVSIAKNPVEFYACDVRCVCVTFLQHIFGVCMTIVLRSTAQMIKIIWHSITSDPLWIRKVWHMYVVTTLYTWNIRCIWNKKKRTLRQRHSNESLRSCYTTQLPRLLITPQRRKLT